MASPTAIPGDITGLDVAAVVHAANSPLMGGGGVDGAIHRAAGPSLLAECRGIVERQGPCVPGEAVATGAGLMLARWVIHTVGPIFTPERSEEHDATLASAYRRSVEVAGELGVRTIAFPNISTGVYGFPKARAAPIAVNAVRVSAEETAIEEVLFVCHDDENLSLYEDLLS